MVGKLGIEPRNLRFFRPALLPTELLPRRKDWRADEDLNPDRSTWKRTSYHWKIDPYVGRTRYDERPCDPCWRKTVELNHTPEASADRLANDLSHQGPIFQCAMQFSKIKE